MRMSEKVKREKIIKIRVSPEEDARLKMLKTKVSLAEWMRESCLNQSDLVSQIQEAPKVDPALLRQLAGVGNNLNQIARVVNSGEWGPMQTIEIIAALKKIEQQLEGIRELHR